MILPLLLPLLLPLGAAQTPRKPAPRPAPGGLSGRTVNGQALPKVGGANLPPVDAPGTRGWTRAGITPDDLARRADARLNGLRNAIAEWLATVNIPSGHGQSFGRNVMYAPGRFRIETVRIGRRDEELTKLVWSGQGGKTQVLDTGGWQRRPDFRALPTPLAPAFLLGFDGIVMRATQGAKSFATLVASGRKLGYGMVVERRRSGGPGTESELRLVMTKGATRYAVSWNERRMLPSAIALQSTGAKGAPVRVLWLGAWAVKSAPLTAADVANVHPSSNQPLKRR